jgi:predicted nucleic acid-binding protein
MGLWRFAVIATRVNFIAIGRGGRRGCSLSISGAPGLVDREEPAKNKGSVRIFRIGMNLTLVCGLLIGSLPLGAQSSASAEYKSKARVLVNIPSFIEWPESAFPSGQTYFSVCALGEFRFGIFLADLARGRTKHGRPIEIRWLKKDQDLQTCQILYVSRSESKRYAEIMGVLRGSNILTIGETSNFLDAGGAIVFSFREEEGLRFDVNLSATNAAHLKISSSLLALARRVLNTPEAAKS